MGASMIYLKTSSLSQISQSAKALIDSFLHKLTHWRNLVFQMLFMRTSNLDKPRFHTGGSLSPWLAHQSYRPVPDDSDARIGVLDKPRIAERARLSVATG
jgi:hypothetical protein